MKKPLLLLLLPLAVLGWLAYRRGSQPPQVPFSKAVRQSLTSALPTNGKAEPMEWEAVRVEQAGTVTKTPVQEGQMVAQGAILALLSDTGLQADLEAAEARTAQARADLGALDAGGKPLELTNIDNEIARVRLERDHDQREYASLRRLLEKQASTEHEVNDSKSKLDAADLALEALEKRRTALVSQSDKTVARARLKDAEAAVALARAHIGQTIMRAPLSGMVYGLAARPGVYLNPGDLVANVGQVDRMRVRVYVDEPELGSVQPGQQVAITWDALPGRVWQGVVERKPAAIVALGTRQVGEVLCTIANPGRDLLPGTNVDANIQTATVTGAITIPKECLRRDRMGPGVFLLRAGRLAWQPVTLGISSATRVQLTRGVDDGEAVALPTELALHDGEAVTPAYP